MDGSNAWPDKRDGDETGVWQSKEPYDHFIVDRYGNKLRIWYFPVIGGMVQPHDHPFPHDSHIIRGSVRVTGDAENRDGQSLVAPDSVFFDAGVSHSIKSLTENTFIIHSYPPEFTWKQIRCAIRLRLQLSARRIAVKIGLRSDYKEYDPGGMA